MSLLKIPVVAVERIPCAGIHTSPCEHCPSTKGSDPESEDIKTWPHAERVQTAFPCAWRPNKYCKGYCDAMGITETDLKDSS